MKIKKLLFVTRFDELLFDALRSLLDLRKANLGHVVLLNVIERKKVAMRRGTGYRKETEVRLREKANIRFIDWAETLFEEGMEVGVHIVVGSFAGQVVKAAVTEEVDLIVISPERKGHIERLCSGSDLTEIIRRAGRPVLVHKRHSDESVIFKNPFVRPLLTTSWTSTSSRAVRHIKNLTSIVERVDVVHVASEKNLKGFSAMEVQITRKQSRQKLELICHEIETANVIARPHVYVGDVASEINKAARECESSMIIVGYSKKNLLGERWTGSIGKELAEKSSFPILLMPPGDD